MADDRGASGAAEVGESIAWVPEQSRPENGDILPRQPPIGVAGVG